MLGPVRRARVALIATVAVAMLLAAAAPALAAFGQRTLRMGSRGPSVRTLQFDLTALGFPTPVDGKFGRRTKNNVKRWERRSGKPVNGVVSRGDAKGILRQAKKLGGASQAAPTQPSTESTRSSDGAGGQTTTPTSPTPIASSSALAFPIQGAHDYGTSVNRFGAPRGGRSHMGQDVLADCGLPVVAVEGGTVVYSGYEGSAGNYIVVKGAKTKRDYVYMHLRRPAYFQADDTVRTGERIGLVGDTGDATACHLHFELWTAPGWYNGGDAVDPLRYLKEWDAAS